MNLLNKTIAIFLLIMFPCISFADTKGKFSFLDENEKAPFSGVLYDAQANGVLLSRIKTATETMNLRLLQQKEQLTLNFDKKLKLREAELQSKIRVKERLNDSLREENEKLQEVVKNPPTNWGNIFLATGIGIIIGAVATGLAVGFTK